MSSSKQLQQLTQAGVCLLVTILISSCTTSAGKGQFGWEPASSPGDVSGLVRLGSGELLAIHDTKVGKSSDKTPRVSQVDKEHLTVSGIPIRWPKGQVPASDLEAGSSIPGSSTHDVLLFESGYYKGKYGRVFRCTPEYDAKGKLTALRTVQYWQWPAGTEDVEGAFCATSPTPDSGELHLVIAQRTGKLHSAMLRTDTPNGTSIVFQPLAGTVSLPSFPELSKEGYRPISDLYVDAKSIVWAAATQDPGENGPFRSVVYNVAQLQVSPRGPVLRTPARTRKSVVEGLKVEGLQSGATGGTLIFGSDDENFGGALRPISKP